MRREGYEMEVNAPEVIFTKNKEGKKLEPIERIKFDIPLDAISVVMDRLNKRLGNITQTVEKENDISQLIVEIPTRGLFGF